MWTRALLKDNAKQALSGRYWRCFLVCFVMALLGVAVGNGPSSIILSAGYNAGVVQYELWPEEPDVWEGNFPQDSEVYWDRPSNAATVILSLSLLLAVIVALCWIFFMTNPLQVGMARYYMENRQSSSPFGTVWTVFRTPYLNVVKVQCLVSLKITLGLFLFFVPGIYWSFCYRQVPYLLAENPYLSTRRAMELSRQMMLGEKWKSFVLDMSFIGWYWLGALLLGIGTLFVHPYYQATCAELYAALRSKAFALRLTDSNELSGFVRHDPNP